MCCPEAWEEWVREQCFSDDLQADSAHPLCPNEHYNYHKLDWCVCCNLCILIVLEFKSRMELLQMRCQVMTSRCIRRCVRNKSCYIQEACCQLISMCLSCQGMLKVSWTWMHMHLLTSSPAKQQPLTATYRHSILQWGEWLAVAMFTWCLDTRFESAAVVFAAIENLHNSRLKLCKQVGHKCQNCSRGPIKDWNQLAVAHTVHAAGTFVLH